jgi:uncharacterized membrane protein YeaQ/YmgE (transglycosylase-associated protein family)
VLAEIDISVGEVIIYVVAGAIIGVLARLLMPGEQNLSIVATVVLGVVAAIVGGYLWEAIFPNNDGIAWIGSIIVALVLLWIVARVMSGRART